MRGVWTTVIVPMAPSAIEQDPPYDFVQLTATAFARFPYPESFIVWKSNGHDDGLTFAFNRAERRPEWDIAESANDPFPVTLIRNPPGLSNAVTALRQQAVRANSFGFLEVNINGTPYQIVAHFMFEPGKSHSLFGLAAFTVNLNWLRQKYFGPLLTQVTRIGSYGEAFSLAVLDDRGLLVTSTGAPPTGGELKSPFPLLFLDPTAMTPVPQGRTPVRQWTVHVRPNNDITQLAAIRTSKQMFLLMVLTAMVSVLALFLTLRAIRAIALLAAMKSDFVSSITHELKTPLQLIRLVGDTLASGRYTATETIQDYAKLLSHNASRLSQSIDSLLIAARYSESASLRSTELKATDLHGLVEDALESFRPALEQHQFHLELDISRQLPQVLVDRPAMIQAIESIVDNAIKYSGNHRSLRITSRIHDQHVEVTFADRGNGISQQDLTRVFDRFYRGRNANTNGSGLGLAIARRIVRIHGGDIRISSKLDVGTAVVLSLIAAKA